VKREKLEKKIFKQVSKVKPPKDHRLTVNHKAGDHFATVTVQRISRNPNDLHQAQHYTVTVIQSR